MPSTADLATYQAMQKADPKAVGRRLRALQKLVSAPTVQTLADLIGAERNRVSGWLNGYGLPPVPLAILLFEAAEARADTKGFTLDWLYLGAPDGMPVSLAIRLAALEEAIPVPVAAPDPEPHPESEPAVASSAHRRASRKTAT